MTKSTTCCDTQSGLRSLDSAIENLLAKASPTQMVEDVPLLDCLGRILAEDIHSTVTVPPHDNSAVDGYAIRLEDFSEDSELSVSARVPAGTHPEQIIPNTAVRIFTGATIPAGANCVIMQENCVADETNNTVKINQAPSLGQNIRLAGQDLKSGEKIIAAGTLLAPQHMGLIAPAGASRVHVYKKLKVAIMSTGDELVEPGIPLKPSQIYNSNRYMLSGFLTKLGFETIDLGVIADNLEDTINALKQASTTADVVITTGGASVGEEDHIQSAIKALGKIDFWRIAIKPGKPFMFGKINDTPILGLPGNPGAVFVTFLVLARPFLLQSQGHTNPMPQGISANLGFNVKKPGKRREFLRVQYEDGQVKQHTNQSSGMLSSATWAQGLAVIPENSQLSEGDAVLYYPFTVLLGS